MSIFSADFISFFQELSVNNHRDWFAENKKRYEKEVKKPFQALVATLIDRMNEEGANLAIEAKDCILRINRDIRFAKDKTPYNVHVTAFISPGGRKDKSVPGFAIRLSSEMVGVMIGTYGPSKEQLLALRREIAADPQTFTSLITAPDFVAVFGDLRGEQHKRIPPEFKEAVQEIPQIANKQFYFMGELSPQLIPSDRLVDELINCWQLSRPFSSWMTKTIA